MSMVTGTIARTAPGAQTLEEPSMRRAAALRWMFTARGELFAAMLAGVMLLAGVVLVSGFHLASAGALYWASLAIGMVHGGRAAFEALSKRTFDIDVLMVVGAGLAAWVGAPGEGALLLFLFVLSGALEAMAAARTRRAVASLYRLMPTGATRWVGAADGSTGRWEVVAPGALAPDDRIRVLPGELIPTDAALLSGESEVDQATLTGESNPRPVAPGDDLFAGTINVGHPFEARVVRPASESSLQKILNLVIQAQQQRQPIQRLIDRVSEPYSLGVLAASVVVLIVWWRGFGVPLVSGGDGPGAVYTAITLLIVASPCALIISTPTATLAAITRGARSGVLFKGGQAIERLGRVGAVAFDKTGTLTVGRPQLNRMEPIAWSSEEALLAVAAGLEEESTHPIGAAVRAAASERGITPARTVEPKSVPGRGVGAIVEGKPARLGTYVFVEELIPVCLRARVAEVLAQVQRRGDIGTTVAWNGHAGVLVLSDRIRPGAPELVERLHGLGVRPVCMLTGDNTATARRIAEELGLDEWHAELLPAGKVGAVERLKKRGEATRPVCVGVIGDGVNDAPALAAADVSIAIGSIGSDAAIESADIVLLSDDLSVVPWAVSLACRTRRTIAANLVFSLSAILVMALATLIGSRIGHAMPLWVGVLGHEGGTLLVVANSLTLLAYSQTRWHSAPRTLSR